MNCYYAHCRALYNTPQEARDEALIESLGFAVVSPNTPQVENQCDEVRASGRNEMVVVFRPIVRRCDALAFRALPHGDVPAGVAQEVGWAREEGIPVFELPSGVLRRTLSIEETREYKRECGSV